MIDLCLEGDDGSFEGEIIEFELELELSLFEWGLLWSSDEDTPNSFLFFDDFVASKWSIKYAPSSYWTSLLSLGSMASLI